MTGNQADQSAAITDNPETPTRQSGEIVTRRQLTARGVKARLTRAGIDHSALSITDKVETSRQIDISYSGPWQRHNVVLIHGTSEQRRPAFHVLFDAGFVCAPYPDHDEWKQ